ncbi:MAG: hypothetical protein K1X75_13405 [Leptospirales bacterium]|nr:hypothetical protein [Leptospirales bacterium]
MNHFGAIVLSFEEVGDLGELSPWKEADAAQLCGRLRALAPLSGFVFLSTCNRVEAIYTLDDPGAHTHFAFEFLAQMPPLRAGLRPQFLHGQQAVRHLIRLAAGLESMALGETEIRAQLKSAFEQAPALDKRLRLLFQRVFRESRRIRASIPLGQLPVSIAALAARRLHELMGDDASGARRAAVVGSGPMSRQSARYLAKQGYRILLINRSKEKVADLLRDLSAEYLSFDDFYADPGRAGALSALVTATSREDAWLDRALAERMLQARRPALTGAASGNAPGPDGAGLCLVDLAVPRDVDPGVEQLEEIRVIHMDGMRAELEHNRSRRRQAAEAADRMIDKNLLLMEGQMIAALAAPVMSSLQSQVRERSRAHLDDLLEGRLKHLSARDRRLLYSWAIQANRDLNRLHGDGLAAILRHYYGAAGAAENDGESLN